MGKFRSLYHILWFRARKLFKETQTVEVGLGPARAFENLLDYLGAKGIALVMVDKKQAPAVWVLVDVVGASGFSPLKAFMFCSADPLFSGEVF